MANCHRGAGWLVIWTTVFVQDLAGTSFALSGLARATHESAMRVELERLASAVRGCLRPLRSLLLEIYPPRLEAAGLGAALQSLVAQQAGVHVHVSWAERNGVG